jgi:hypothetical protein
MTSDQQRLRSRLRARGRQLGDRLDRGKQGIEHLVAECAYEQWHWMLFARFLAECGLLIEPSSGVPVSVDECKELARERGADWISLASAFAQDMLPQIFRADDAVLEIALPAEHRQPLEQLLMSLPTEVFLADDSLGWVYQFWQSEEKDRVNASADKIGAEELPAVTQLFTEDYMVEFLLHNTLGAWWAGLRCPEGIEASSEQEARAAVALPSIEWKSLRFTENDQGKWVPAAGTFDGWPNAARDIRILDPCMGSGHFLVFAFPILVAMRGIEEGLSVAEACAAVVRDNLFGLEIDARCTQIGAFNLELAAWKLSGWQQLPPLNLACAGLGPNAKREDWLRLAGTDHKARNGMEQLYDLFAQAPVLGSLINPRQVSGDLLVSGFHELQPLLEKALRQEPADEASRELIVTARGVAHAAELLSGYFNLVATNVPYLARGKQTTALQGYCEQKYGLASADLATCFVERCLQFCISAGTVALVTPQNWLYQDAYRDWRRHLIGTTKFEGLAKLGAGAFEGISGEVVNVALILLSRRLHDARSKFFVIDALREPSPEDKAHCLKSEPITFLLQNAQTLNPDCRIGVDASSPDKLLNNYASFSNGLQTGDYLRYVRCFWELDVIRKEWSFFQTTVQRTTEFDGLHYVVFWEGGGGVLAKSDGAVIRGTTAWGKPGVAVSAMGALQVALYSGQLYDDNTVVITPFDKALLPALWSYCASPQYHDDVRKLDRALKVRAPLVKVPFNVEHWRRVAQEAYPGGLPKANSNDPTQWLFNGHPKGSQQPLQVAVARLVGYRWPRQTGSSFTDCPPLDSDGLEGFEDEDGIVCISASRGEESAAERLRVLLAAAFGTDWSAGKLEELLARVNYAGKELEDWLRNGFFQQHCECFYNRPVVWHIWDGRRDGFAALVNSQRISKANLEKLTYAYLGDWVRRQEAAVVVGEAGSEARLVAASQLQEELKKILEGDPPYDIFVRWKELARQPVGWEPDLNDGVRVNIRPFVIAADVGNKGAGILRIRPNIKWDKDRGKEQARAKDEFPWFWGWDGKTSNFAGGSTFDGNRWNHLHYSREFKMAARRRKGLA